MSEEAYQELAELFDKMGFGIRYCPELDALTLVPRPDRKEPFTDFRALIQKQFEEKMQAGEI
jgi:hypothetical protein